MLQSNYLVRAYQSDINIQNRIESINKLIESPGTDNFDLLPAFILLILATRSFSSLVACAFFYVNVDYAPISARESVVTLVTLYFA